MDTIKFWSNPKQASDFIKLQQFYKFTLPEFYLNLQGFSDIINTTIEKHAAKDWSILDVGCGTGRGLAELYRKGYRNLTGIEINAEAIEIGRRTFPELEDITILCAPVEEVAHEIQLSFDCIYSVGCLMHLPYYLDWVLEIISMSARRMVITAENETEANALKYPRNYKSYFVDLFGWKQIEQEGGEHYPPISKATIKRVFVK